MWLDRSRLPADITMGVVARIDEGRLRHPVFGNRKRWVTQTARPAGWWSHTVQTGTPRMQAEVERVLRDVRRDLE